MEESQAWPPDRPVIPSPWTACEKVRKSHNLSELISSVAGYQYSGTVESLFLRDWSTHTAWISLSQLGSQCWDRKWIWAPILSQKLAPIENHMQKKNSVFSCGISLARPHAQRWVPNTKQTHWYFWRLCLLPVIFVLVYLNHNAVRFLF